MLCLQPFVRDKNGHVWKRYALGDKEDALDGVPFPCGQCLPCLINKRRVWTNRLMLESLEHEESSFITLTYKDEMLPFTPDRPEPTLCVRDAQLFLKRLRKGLTDYVRKNARRITGNKRLSVPSYKFRYYLCGEYGTIGGRPHYHAILFGVPPDAIKFVEKAWTIDGESIGKIDVQPINENNIQYVAGYVTKKMTRRDDGRKQEFSIMSRKPGIGSNAIPKLVEMFTNEETGQYFDIVHEPPVLMHGRKKLPLGRYLRDRVMKEMNLEKDLSPFVEKMFQKYLEAKRSNKYVNCYLERLLIDESKQRNLQIRAIHKVYKSRNKVQ